MICVSRSHFPCYYDLLAWTSDDPNWNSLKTGEIFHTGGILTKKLYKTTNRGDFRI
ncbi:hypothetical protein K443DRAFT_117308 [Laccaria amethystina LaAM-08-1]|uniref:Uncharacterized protein n=1 Tax=Laccaria amethystina LaAM-08-1 TaxID=1095629 RepID=A0A0C9WX77_9AGAR|nr:hypothetical protein K443DRAFT_117308 [Laccaria amethystina LaAM-08-1]